MTEPEMTCGSRLPMSAMNGLSAMRSGYFNSSRRGGRPLARAGDHVLLLQLVEQVGAQPPDHAGGAGGADDDHRDPEMLEHRAATLAQLHGWSMYSGSIRPPIDVPN